VTEESALQWLWIAGETMQEESALQWLWIASETMQEESALQWLCRLLTAGEEIKGSSLNKVAGSCRPEYFSALTLQHSRPVLLRIPWTLSDLIPQKCFYHAVLRSGTMERGLRGRRGSQCAKSMKRLSSGTSQMSMLVIFLSAQSQRARRGAVAQSTNSAGNSNNDLFAMYVCEYV
jgi:hypothetical protein